MKKTFILTLLTVFAAFALCSCAPSKKPIAVSSAVPIETAAPAPMDGENASADTDGADSASDMETDLENVTEETADKNGTLEETISLIPKPEATFAQYITGSQRHFEEGEPFYFYYDFDGDGVDEQLVDDYPITIYDDGQSYLLEDYISVGAGVTYDLYLADLDPNDPYTELIAVSTDYISKMYREPTSVGIDSYYVSVIRYDGNEVKGAQDDESSIHFNSRSLHSFIDYDSYNNEENIPYDEYYLEWYSNLMTPILLPGDGSFGILNNDMSYDIYALKDDGSFTFTNAGKVSADDYSNVRSTADTHRIKGSYMYLTPDEFLETVYKYRATENPDTFNITAKILAPVYEKYESGGTIEYADVEAALTPLIEAGYTPLQAKRLAYCELFANHGYDFLDPLVDQYFYEEHSDLYTLDPNAEYDARRYFGAIDGGPGVFNDFELQLADWLEYWKADYIDWYEEYLPERSS